jgi:hypothetical protein
MLVSSLNIKQTLNMHVDIKDGIEANGATAGFFLWHLVDVCALYVFAYL